MAPSAPLSPVDEDILTGIPRLEESLWTSKQRASCPLHEVPYRACFKAQLPEYFIREFTREGDSVYDPFSGRGTTVLEAVLNRRLALGSDINPLSAMLVRSRVCPPAMNDLEDRLSSMVWNSDEPHDPDLLAFYHPSTLTQLLALRSYLLGRIQTGQFDLLDDWIRMVALTRLSGHSTHFFSVYTLPPNQAVSAVRQRKINQQRNQQPEPRDVAVIIRRKSGQLIRRLTPAQSKALNDFGSRARVWTGSSTDIHEVEDQSIDLIVTSPPFLNEVDYRGDNWLRCWFAGIDLDQIKIRTPRKESDWQQFMMETLRECRRIIRPTGRVVFEVGEVRKGKIQLERPLILAGLEAGLQVEKILINRQTFTKTANCWGVKNMADGTNSNRLVVFKP